MIRFRRALPWLTCLAPLVAAISASCSGEVVTPHADSGSATGTGAATSTSSTDTSVGGAASSGGSMGGGGSISTSTFSGSTGGSTATGTSCQTGREIFEQTCKAQLLQECNACHMLGGISDAPFLAQPDVYTSMDTWPGMVVPDPADSVLFNFVPNDQEPPPTPALHTALVSWLEAEAEVLPGPASMPHLIALKPYTSGLNTVFLDPLGPSFAGSAVTFTATLANAAGALVLSQLQIHAASGVSLHVVHPRFALYSRCAMPAPDPADTFAAVDAVFASNTSATLGSGTVPLPGWQDGAWLTISFEGLDSMSGPGLTSCKALATFEAEVAPQLMTKCLSCHQGGDASAKAAMDLSTLASDPDKACAAVRAWITPGDPTSSAIDTLTDPTMPAVHAFKFAGNAVAHHTFVSAVTPWILAEQ